jgi:CheY-like chemotaxis protein
VRFALAENGLEALAQLEEDTFDMIFMDYQMPVMDGLESSKRIRKSDKSYRTMPIVALTASAIEGDEDTCKRAGMTGYLVKPVRLEQIAKAVSAYSRRPD